jgi:hypothetical protein
MDGHFDHFFVLSILLDRFPGAMPSSHGDRSMLTTISLTSGRDQ